MEKRNKTLQQISDALARGIPSFLCNVLKDAFCNKMQEDGVNEWMNEWNVFEIHTDAWGLGLTSLGGPRKHVLTGEQTLTQHRLFTLVLPQILSQPRPSARCLFGCVACFTCAMIQSSIFSGITQAWSVDLRLLLRLSRTSPSHDWAGFNTQQSQSCFFRMKGHWC